MELQQHFFTSQEEWKAARSKRFTSSEMHRLMPDGKGEDGLSVGAMTYINEKVAEILTGQPKEEFFNYQMNWGVEHEPEAVTEFAAYMGIDLSDPEFLYCGGKDPVFYSMSTIAGGSPDVVYNGEPGWIAEAKCPTSAMHLQHLQATAETFRKDFSDKWIQCQSNMLFTGKPLCYFISYDPRFTIRQLQLKIIEIPADLDYQNLILKKVHKAKLKLDEILQAVYAANEVDEAINLETLTN